MTVVDHINYRWTIDRWASTHWLSAGYSVVSGEGVLYLRLTPWQPRLTASVLRMWEVRDAQSKTDALARFLGTMMAEINGAKS
ncbi:MAG: hypothetical protein BWY85_00061 [Firmicutes bacterium ADurb.Bin506]|nr:MAG: hypothetical protein BWY85_00061 [Firmicutes bacterium ADurb.Bin506]